MSGADAAAGSVLPWLHIELEADKASMVQHSACQCILKQCHVSSNFSAHSLAIGAGLAGLLAGSSIAVAHGIAGSLSMSLVSLEPRFDF